jgi:6-pyruvoyl-tetrahydropterin synthase
MCRAFDGRFPHTRKKPPRRWNEVRTRISKTFDFDAAHHLPFVSEGHKCRRMHGHTYRVELVCEGTLDERGMICDYSATTQEHDGPLAHRVTSQ